MIKEYLYNNFKIYIALSAINAGKFPASLIMALIISFCKTPFFNNVSFVLIKKILVNTPKLLSCLLNVLIKIVRLEVKKIILFLFIIKFF
jgi:hypothetical protein